MPNFSAQTDIIILIVLLGFVCFKYLQLKIEFIAYRRKVNRQVAEAREVVKDVLTDYKRLRQLHDVLPE